MNCQYDQIWFYFTSNNRIFRQMHTFHMHNYCNFGSCYFFLFECRSSAGHRKHYTMTEIEKSFMAKRILFANRWTLFEILRLPLTRRVRILTRLLCSSALSYFDVSDAILFDSLFYRFFLRLHSIDTRLTVKRKHPQKSTDRWFNYKWYRLTADVIYAQYLHEIIGVVFNNTPLCCLVHSVV